MNFPLELLRNISYDFSVFGRQFCNDIMLRRICLRQGVILFMKILVTDIPFIFEKDFYQRYDDSILDEVQNALTEEGHSVDVCHAHNDRLSQAAFEGKFKNIWYDLVFIYIFFYRQQFFQENSLTLRHLFRSLSEVNPNIHFSGFGQPLVLTANLDDYKLLSLHSFCAGGTISAIQSIARMLSSGKTPAGAVSGDLEKPLQTTSHYTVDDQGLNIYTSLGCGGQCSFCTETLSQGRWQPFDTEEVIKTIQMGICKYHPMWIKINDLNFLGYKNIEDNRTYLKAFAKRYKETCDNKIPIKLSTRVDSVDANILDLLKQMGVSVIFYGIESGVQRILDSFLKNITPKKSLQTLKETYYAGIMPQMGFIFFEPSMTISELKNNICFLRESGEFTYLSLQLIDRLRIFKNTTYEKMNCQKTGFHSEIFCCSYTFEHKEVEMFYNIWKAFFEKSKNIDMYIRNRLDLLMLRGYSHQDDNLLKIHRKIVTQYNSIVIDILEQIYYGQISSDIAANYEKKVHEIILMLGLTVM